MSDLDTGNAPVETPAATEGLSTQSETPAAPVSHETPAAPVSIEDTMREVWEKHNPTRADDGKFAAKDNPAEVVKTDAAVTTDQPKETPAETVKPSIDAPNSWSAEMKARFGELPPETREYIASRESESHKAITQLGQRVKAFEPLAQTVTRHSDFIERFGLSSEQAVENLFTAARSLQNDPAEFIRHIAKTHGVDLGQLVGQPTAEGQAQSVDPRLGVLERRLAQAESLLTAQQRQQVEAQTKSIESEIEAFAKAKPHWAALENDIEMEVRAIKLSDPSLSATQILEKAYERAQWANPDIRQRILADQQKADEDKRRVEAEKKAQEARKVAPINQRSSKGASPAASADMRDTMAAVAAKYGLR